MLLGKGVPSSEVFARMSMFKVPATCIGPKLSFGRASSSRRQLLGLLDGSFLGRMQYSAASMWGGWCLEPLAASVWVWAGMRTKMHLPPDDEPPCP